MNPGGFIFNLQALLQVLFVLTLTIQPAFAKRYSSSCDTRLTAKNERYFGGLTEEEYKANREASLRRRLETVPTPPTRIDRDEKARLAREKYEAEREARRSNPPAREYNRQPNRDARSTPSAPVARQGRRQASSPDVSGLRAELHDQVAKAHKYSLSYREARTVIMGQLDYHNDAKGSYVWDKYCQQAFPIHPGEMPSPNELNIEHTWPQSKFTSKYPPNVQKSDLHHLFATDSMANGLRGHLNFGEVVNDTKSMPCKGIHVGTNDHGEIVFEGPSAHKGDMARAIFYFAVRYDMQIDPVQEAVLRQWHQEDPVSDEEMERNNKIEKIQGNRNPFIDRPELVEQIENF